MIALDLHLDWRAAPPALLQEDLLATPNLVWRPGNIFAGMRTSGACHSRALLPREESRGSDGRVGSSYTAQGIRDSSRAQPTGMTESGGKVKDNRPNIMKLLAGHYTRLRPAPLISPDHRH